MSSFQSLHHTLHISQHCSTSHAFLHIVEGQRVRTNEVSQPSFHVPRHIAQRSTLHIFLNTVEGRTVVSNEVLVSISSPTPHLSTHRSAPSHTFLHTYLPACCLRAETSLFSMKFQSLFHLPRHISQHIAPHHHIPSFITYLPVCCSRAEASLFYVKFQSLFQVQCHTPRLIAPHHKSACMLLQIRGVFILFLSLFYIPRRLSHISLHITYLPAYC